MFGNTDPEELRIIAEIYDRCGGDLATIAYLCNISLHVLQKNPPYDAMHFAKQLMEGFYTTDKSKVDKAS